MRHLCLVLIHLFSFQNKAISCLADPRRRKCHQNQISDTFIFAPELERESPDGSVRFGLLKFHHISEIDAEMWQLSVCHWKKRGERGKGKGSGSVRVVAIKLTENFRPRQMLANANNRQGTVAGEGD